MPSLPNGYDGDVVFYDDVNPSRESEIAAYRRLLGDRVDALLDVACGTGQITQGLAQGRTRTVGIDSSTGMLERAKTRLGERADFAIGDMRGWDLGEKFDAITCTFNALQHLLTLDEWLGFLDASRRHLRREGRLIFDIQCPHFDFLKPHRAGVFRFSFYSEAMAREVDLHEDTAYDRATQINTIDYVYTEAGGGAELFRHRFTMRQVYPLELDAILRMGNFTVLDKFGGLDGRPFDGDALQQVVVCTPASTS